MRPSLLTLALCDSQDRPAPPPVRPNVARPTGPIDRPRATDRPPDRLTVRPPDGARDRPMAALERTVIGRALGTGEFPNKCSPRAPTSSPHRSQRASKFFSTFRQHVKQLPNCCSMAKTRPNLSRVGPFSGQFLPNLANMAEFDKHLADIGRIWPMLAELGKRRPNWSTFGPTCVDFGQHRPEFGQVLAPDLGNVARNMRLVGSSRADPRLRGNLSTAVGHNSSATVGHLRSSPGSPGAGLSRAATVMHRPDRPDARPRCRTTLWPGAPPTTFWSSSAEARRCPSRALAESAHRSRLGLPIF